MKKSISLLFALLFIAASPASAQNLENLFELEATTLIGNIQAGSEGNDVLDLIEDFADQTGVFAVFAGAVGYRGRFDYLGLAEAIQFDVSNMGNTLRLRIPLTGTDETFSGSSPDEVGELVEDWLKQKGASEWADFLRAANGLTPLAVISGNPKSTVALMGSSAYRRFGIDDSRSRFGFEQGNQRIGGVGLRLDIGLSTLETANFKDDLRTVDPTLMVSGSFGRYVGLAASIIGQYRDYQGGEVFDLGFEIALPITLSRPDRSEWFWQLTPLVQVAAGASKNLASGGLFMGGGLVHALGYNMGPFEFMMANEMLYYGGIPIDDVGGYDFDTKLSQLFFKNGLEASWHPAWGLYADAGMDFTNFAIDEAAVPFYYSPRIGVGWNAGRWADVRIGYRADLDTGDYVAHNLNFKLNLLF